jgi:agmatinase
MAQHPSQHASNAPASFDPDAAAQPGTGVFGLPHTFEQAGCVLIPAPFDATTSYGGGASAGPAAILAASAQVDLFDLQFGRVYEFGLFMQDIDAAMQARSSEARALAEPIIAKAGADPEDVGDRAILKKVDEASEWMNAQVYDRVKHVLDSGRVPGLVGGDHSTPFGAIKACAEKAAASGEPLGILHVDAHMDLRDAFEGFTWSHASIMFNVLRRIPNVRRLVQVGIRDFGEGELRVAAEPAPPLTSPMNPNDSWMTDAPVAAGPVTRVVTHFDLDLFRRHSRGEAWEATCQQIVAALPRLVYISFDIDGLDPAMCPHTGTPVPGGLSFNHAAVLLETLARSGRRVVGFDLNEVCPSPDESNEWDANVGARILYKLCGCVYRSVRGW